MDFWALSPFTDYSTVWTNYLYAPITSHKWPYIHLYHTVDSFWGSYTVWCLPLAFWTFFHFSTFKLNAVSIPFTNMGGCELIHFFAYLLATPQISQKVEKFMHNLLMTRQNQPWPFSLMYEARATLSQAKDRAFRPSLSQHITKSTRLGASPS